MNITLVALIIGVAAIVQGGMNSRLMPYMGLTHMVVLNNLVALGLSLGLWAVAKWAPQVLPEIFHLKTEARFPGLWALWPAAFGILIVAGLPYAFTLAGALTVFILLIAAQLIAGQVWDLTVEGHTLSVWKIVGGVIALFGVWVAGR
jgi:uncharacterized membrane protein YdcZ (DUF606 family)